MPPEDIKPLEMSQDAVAKIAEATREVDRLRKAMAGLKEGDSALAGFQVQLKGATAGLEQLQRVYGRVAVQVAQNTSRMTDFKKEIGFLGREVGLNVM